MNDFLDELSYLAAGLHFALFFPLSWLKWTVWFTLHPPPPANQPLSFHRLPAFLFDEAP